MATYKDLLEEIQKSPLLQSLSPEELAQIKDNYESVDSETLDMVIAKIKETTAKNEENQRLLEEEANKKAQELEEAIAEAKTFLRQKSKEEEIAEKQKEDQDICNLEDQIKNL